MTTNLEQQPTIGEVKRVLEWWTASPDFRALVQRDTLQAAKEYNLGFDPEVIRALWDLSFAREAAKENLPVHPSLQAYRDFFQSKVTWRGVVKEECTPSDDRFKVWRQRQIARSVLESGNVDDYLIHTPVSFELTRGCSVGCWFCGVDALKFSGVWPYDEVNAALWREVLEVVRNKVGTASRWGFCYWATDPLDNPDYEKFALDYAEIIGMYPQTTTAQGHKDPERVKRLLKVSNKHGCRVNRFSVLTLKYLRQIFEAYTPDELTDVEVIAQNHESTLVKADAGAFRRNAAKNSKIASREIDKIKERYEAVAPRAEDSAEPVNVLFEQPGTIACVSGFLFNMLDRTIQLISPCHANERWPRGYIVFEKRTFETAQDVETVMEEMMERHMLTDVAPSEPIRFHPDFSYNRTANGFNISSSTRSVEFQRPELTDYVGYVGDMILKGDKTADEIALLSYYVHRIPEANTMGTLNALLRSGVLVDGLGRIADGA